MIERILNLIIALLTNADGPLRVGFAKRAVTRETVFLSRRGGGGDDMKSELDDIFSSVKQRIG